MKRQRLMKLMVAVILLMFLASTLLVALIDVRPVQAPASNTGDVVPSSGDVSISGNLSTGSL